MPFNPRALFPLIGFLIFLSLSSYAQQHVVAPVERNNFTALTSYAELRTFLQEMNSHGMQVDSLTETKQGRGVFAVKISSSSSFGSDAHKVRVLLFAQQHGDEPSGKEAMTMLLAKIASGEYGNILSSVDLLIVPQMNPDGSELQQRRTADGIDLNRNHVLLTSPATKALHDLFYQWMPEVTMDIHEYGSFSSEWGDSGFIKTGDVQLGMLTNMNTSSSVHELQHRGTYPFIAQRMKRKGYSFHEYIVGSPGMYVRHSTTEINDGRQSFGILGTVSFIQEGRKWRDMADHLQRRTLSQFSSAEALLEYCASHGKEIKEIVSAQRRRLSARAGRSVAVRMDHVSGKSRLSIPVRMLKGDVDTIWRVHPYRGEVKLLKSVMLPEKYFIKRSDSSIVALLHRHHVLIDTVKEDAIVKASSYSIENVGQTILEEDTIPSVSVNRLSESLTCHRGDFIISTKQVQSNLLAIVLEPESYWGLTKYDGYSYLLKQKRYPVLRTP